MPPAHQLNHPHAAANQRQAVDHTKLPAVVPTSVEQAQQRKDGQVHYADSDWSSFLTAQQTSSGSNARLLARVRFYACYSSQYLAARIATQSVLPPASNPSGVVYPLCARKRRACDDAELAPSPLEV